MNFAVHLVFPVLVAKQTFALLSIQPLGVLVLRRSHNSGHGSHDGCDDAYDAEPRKDRRRAVFGRCYGAKDAERLYRLAGTR
jgi:hypothetical protein